MKPKTVSVSFGATIQTRPYENIQPSVTIEVELEKGETLDDVVRAVATQARFQVADQVRRMLEYWVQQVDWSRRFSLPSADGLEDWLESQKPMYGWLRLVDPGAASSVRLLAYNLLEAARLVKEQLEAQREAQMVVRDSETADDEKDFDFCPDCGFRYDEHQADGSCPTDEMDAEDEDEDEDEDDEDYDPQYDPDPADLETQPADIPEILDPVTGEDEAALDAAWESATAVEVADKTGDAE